MTVTEKYVMRNDNRRLSKVTTSPKKTFKTKLHKQHGSKATSIFVLLIEKLLGRYFHVLPPWYQAAQCNQYQKTPIPISSRWKFKNQLWSHLPPALTFPSGAVVQWLSLLHNFIQPTLNSGSNPVRGVSEIRNGEDLWQWSPLEI